MSKQRIIKKYPNRRLYDTEESRYITLAEIRQLVLEGCNLKVIDRKSGDDITRSILLQVICEMEQQGESLLTRDVLAGIIRASGSTLQELVKHYLDQSMQFFDEQHGSFQSQVREVAGSDTVETAIGLAHDGLQRFKSVQEEIFRNLQTGNFKSGKPD